MGYFEIGVLGLGRRLKRDPLANAIVEEKILNLIVKY